jgi:hypothetical protein
MSFCCCLATSLIVLTGAAFAADPSPVIVNSGSTNLAGFRIVVDRSGQATYTAVPRRRPAKEVEPVERALPPALVQRFFSDLDAAMPLTGLAVQRCMKSVSFGSTTRIELGVQKTPDLSCPGESSTQVQSLKRDVNEIVKLFTDAGKSNLKALEPVPPSPEPGH